MNAEAAVHSNTALVAPIVTEQGEDQTNLQVGMVLLPENLDFDSGLAHHYNVPLSFLQSSISHDGYRLWAKHFSPCGFPGGVSVPRCWSDFLTLSLLHPSRFEWAKAILESRAWKMMISDTSSETNITFSIPAKCPSSEPIECSLTRNDELQVINPSSFGITDNKSIDQQEGAVTTSALHRKRAVSKVPLVISEVRRSERLKVKYQGFKSSPCAGKSCICCTTNPPTLSKKVIKCLDKEFYNISDSVLNDETLSKKPASKKAAGPRDKQSKKDEGKNNANKKSKK
jgi:hypothetical protein